MRKAKCDLVDKTNKKIKTGLHQPTPKSGKSYYITKHQNKQKPFQKEMEEAGWSFSEDNVDVGLFDRDRYLLAENNQLIPKVSEFVEKKIPIFIWPHTAIHPWWYDRLVEIGDYIRCIFVIGEGQKEVMKIISPHTHVEICGWPWSKQKYFEQPKSLKNVLFAPIHPDGKGAIRPESYEANRTIQGELTSLGLNVTCRYVGGFVSQGLENNDSWNWVKARADNTFQDIDNADIVIAEGVFMYLAIARGKPTIGINQHLPVRTNRFCERFCPPNWHKYGHILAYPINYKEGHLPRLIDWALKEEQLEWRKRLIGNDMEYFSTKIERML